jgi:hypothetical protein
MCAWNAVSHRTAHSCCALAFRQLTAVYFYGEILLSYIVLCHEILKSYAQCSCLFYIRKSIATSDYHFRTNTVKDYRKRCVYSSEVGHRKIYILQSISTGSEDGV